MAAMPPASAHDDVTVVIPCFNYGSFLPEAIASVQGQDGGAPRMIVVDDGSDDPHTLEVLDALPAGVELLRLANGGLAAARNAGVRASDTPLVLALDADDMLSPRALADLKAGLARDPAAGYAYGVMRFFGDWTGDIAMPDWDAYRLLYRHTIGQTALTRRALFDDIGGWDVEIARTIVMGYEDWEFWLHALARGWHGVKVPEVTVQYRRHGSTMLSGARREYRRWYRALRARHADLYRRRPELARQTDMGPLGRAVYRFYWGPRPIPATVEHRLHALLWRQR